MSKVRPVLWFVLVVLAFPAVVMPQEPEGPGGGSTGSSDSQYPATAAEDRPLSGIREQGLGSTRPRHSFIQPSTSISGGWDSNGNFEYGSQSAVSFTGQLSLVTFIGRRGSLEYDGAVRYDTRRLEYEDQLTSSHSLRFSQVFGGRSWSLLLSDEALLTPSAAGGVIDFGLMGFASPEDLGIPVLDPSVVPDQSILTNSSQRFINTAAAEIEHRVSSRTSLTFSGSNGIFRSIDNDLLDGTQYNANAGYNFAFTRRDTLALSCGYEVDRIGRTGMTIRSYSPGLRYSRRQAGRFLAQVSGYAQPYRLETDGWQHDVFSWGGNAGIQYQFSRSTLLVDVNRALSLGSGLLAGSRAVWTSANLAFPIFRRWQFNLNGVYARNSGLRGEPGYTTTFGGVALERHVTRNASIFVHYGLQRGVGNCSITGCGPAMLQNIVSSGFSWNSSPIGIF